MKEIVYLTLEAPREGQASYVHVHEIIAGFRKQGLKVTLYEPKYTKNATSPHLLLRLFHCIILQLKLWSNWPSGAVLYVRAHNLAFLSALIAKIFKIPIIHEVNGTYEDVFVSYPFLNPYRRPLTFIQRYQYKIATGVIAVTEQLQQWVNNEAGRKDCAYISNGANVDLFKPGYIKPDDAPDKYVVFFGGLARWHGVHVMLRAVQNENWPNGIKLLIIGEGQQSKYVQRAAKENANIVYLGRKPYKKIPAYVSSAIAGIIMINNPKNRSSKGVMPLKLFETLACGVPAIVSDLAGQADLIREHGCGIVVPCNDDQELSNAINSLINYDENERLKMSKKARDIIVREHSWFARSQSTLEFINKVI